MLNAGREADEYLSEALMTILENVPALADVGLPVSLPVVELNAAQEGLLVMEYEIVAPRGSDAIGVKP
jgi:hypothetical protein